MTHFYFDVSDGQLATEDDVGIDFPDLKGAVKEAKRAAIDMAKEAMEEGLPGPVIVTIRDHLEGPVLFSMAWSTLVPS